MVNAMDITLERILSLIPKKPDGTFVHGGKKDFADTINLPHNIVAEWVRGKNKSYKNYLYEISAKYNVSVEWLRGETDKKTPDTTTGIGLNPDYFNLSAENRELVDNLIAKLIAGQSGR